MHRRESSTGCQPPLPKGTSLPCSPATCARPVQVQDWLPEGSASYRNQDRVLQDVRTFSDSFEGLFPLAFNQGDGFALKPNVPAARRVFAVRLTVQRD